MRIRFTFEIRIAKEPTPGEPQFEHRDTEAMVEQIGQPRYVGFTPEVDPSDRKP